MRGALGQKVLDALGLGIIPACAGSTRKHAQPKLQARDHPRMCGEHGNVGKAPTRQTGSSPHVRGAPVSQSLLDCRAGIIPACAGSTCCRRASGCRPRDHPRMCGEHHINPENVGNCGGIIPACAGSTARLRTRSASTRDHPRMCGEHNGKNAVTIAAKGSSPHVRGALS